MTVDKAAAEFPVSLGPLSWPLLEQGAATGGGAASEGLSGRQALPFLHSAKSRVSGQGWLTTLRPGPVLVPYTVA